VKTITGLKYRDTIASLRSDKSDCAHRMRQDRDAAYLSGYREFLSMARNVEIAGRVWRVHPNLNLYVDLTADCSCSCDFCIAKTNLDRCGGPPEEMPGWFDQTARIMGDVPCSVQIVGGEPTLYPDIVIALFEIAKSRALRRPVLGTNGYGLVDTGFIDDLMASGVAHVNLSRHHYNDATNREIMHGGRTTGEIEAASRRLSPILRVQCNMIGGYVDTYGEVMQFIAYAYHRLHARSISFAQLTPLPADSFYKREIIDYVADRQVNIEKVLSRVDRDRRFRLVKYRRGVACYYEIWEFTAYDEPITIQFKFSDNSWLEKIDVLPGVLPDIVLHSNGVLSGSWSNERKIIADLAGGEPRKPEEE